MKDYNLVDWLGEFFQPFTTEAYILNLTDPVKKKRMTLLYNEKKRVEALIDKSVKEFLSGKG